MCTCLWGVQGVRNQGDFGGAEKYSLRNQGDFKTDQIKEPGNQVLGAEPGFTAHLANWAHKKQRWGERKLIKLLIILDSGLT
jgi:hypothetical protein